MSSLNLPTLTGGQANPETTSNDADEQLANALTATLTVDLTVDETVSAADYRENIRILVDPAGVSKTLTLQAIARLMLIENDGGNDITVARGATSFTLADGDSTFVYTDGTTDGLVQLAIGGGGGGGAATTLPADIGTYISGNPGAGAVVIRYNVVRDFSLPASLTGSSVTAATAATGSSVFTLKNNGGSIGTATFAAAGTVATFSFASQVDFVVGDVLTIEAPGSQDATLADIGLNFQGFRDLAVTGLAAADIGAFISGKPGAAATVIRYNVVRDFIWESGLADSLFTAGTASAASKVFDIKLNGGSIGSVTFSTSATGTPTFATTTHFVVGDLIEVTAPAVQDTTLADIALNFFGSR